MDYFHCEAIIPDHGIKSMSDKGMRFLVDTNELSPELMTHLFSLKGKFGHVYFAEAPIDAELIKAPDVVPDFKGEKTPSQRLRATLFRLWEQSNTGLEFEVYYRSQMDSLINKLKDRLA